MEAEKKTRRLTLFQLIYDAQDEAFARLVEMKADTTLSALIRSLGFDGALKDVGCDVLICGSVEDYIKATGKNAEDYQAWMVGNTDAASRRICLLSPRVSSTRTMEEMGKVFVHEAVHMIFDLRMGDGDHPLWCEEGIALLLAEQTDLNYVDEKECPRIAELADGEDFADRGGYDYAGIYAGYFIERYGFGKFLELYNHSEAAASLLTASFEADAVRWTKERGTSPLSSLLK